MCAHTADKALTTQLSLRVVEDLLLVAEDVVVHIELVRCRALERQRGAKKSRVGGQVNTSAWACSMTCPLKCVHKDQTVFKCSRNCLWGVGAHTVPLVPAQTSA